MDKFKTAIILAGGKSSRMGFDKQFLRINEKRLIEMLANRLKEEFEEIIIVSNKVENYIGSPYKIVCDEIKEMGPLSGIHIGLKESNSKYVYFTACDMPNINIDYIRFMKEKIRYLNVDACITKKGDKIEPFNGFYSKDIIKDIEDLLLQDRRALFWLINRVNTFYIDEKCARKYSPNWDMFLNLNTKEDLDRYITSFEG